MKNSFCQVCGSSNLIADRALAGRIVCGSCGSTEIGKKNRFNQKNQINNILILFLLALFMVIIFS